MAETFYHFRGFFTNGIGKGLLASFQMYTLEESPTFVMIISSYQKMQSIERIRAQKIRDQCTSALDQDSFASALGKQSDDGVRIGAAIDAGNRVPF